MKFLSGHWKHLLLANYSIDRTVLEPLVPNKTSIDEFDGHVFVSLVAFLFDKTCVLGIPFPFHRKFEEVNLRFYVKPDHDPTIRAVTFIKEIVPKGIIPLVANSLFNENYVKLPMDHGIEEDEFWYSWGKSQANRFSAKVDSELVFPDPGSIGEFITEHYWGFAQGRKSTLAYQVTHPQWKCCEVTDYKIAVDFGETYGEEFAFLNSLTPLNVQYAVGSPVTVSFPSRV